METYGEDEQFEKSLNSFTLIFKEPEEEKNFMESLKCEARYFICFRITFYIVLLTSFVFRIIKLCQMSGKYHLINSGTFAEELIALFIYSGSIIIELLIYFFGIYKKIQDIVVYTVLPIVVIYSAYTANKGPYFGILYIFTVIIIY